MSKEDFSLKLCPSCNAFQDASKMKCPNCGCDLTNLAEEKRRKDVNTYGTSKSQIENPVSAIFVFIFVVLVSLLTIFFFPTNEPGKIFCPNLSSLDDAPKTSIVILSPVLSRFRGDKGSYSFTIAPNLSRYAKKHALPGEVFLLRTTSEILSNGRTVYDWSFAWGYWLFIIVIPSLLISGVILWILRFNTRKNDKVMIF